MRNPPITRAIVSDRFGDVLFDSAETRYGRPGPARPPLVRRYAPSPARPPLVRRYAPSPAPVADPAAPSKISGYILGALASVCALIGVAIAIGWWQ